MRRLGVLAFLCAALLPILAAAGIHGPLTIYNQTDKWAWATAYRGSDHTGIITAFCVGPKSSWTMRGARNTFDGSMYYPYEVRFEVTDHGCKGPIYMDKTFGYNGDFYLTGSDGKYKLSH
jgi:hypothetical protein